MSKLQTVVELPEFQRRAKAIMSDGEREAAIFLITVFAMNEKANLSTKEQAEAVLLSKEIVSMWSDKQ